MAARARPATATVRPGGLDPFRASWDLLTNVKFALVLVGLAALAGLAGVVFPQVPGPMRSNTAARSAWIELRRNDFGSFTGPLDRLGMFDVFHTAWFNGLWVLIIVAVTVCTVSRLRPTIRGVRHPVKQVAPSYFDHAHHHATFTHAGGVEAVEALLRGRRYHVERVSETDGATFLFAERFAWSQYGTFLSHLALLLLLVGALLTRFAGFDRTFVLAENTPAAPVFDSPGPDQLFVKMLDASRGKDTSGNIVDFHSDLEVRRGDRVVTCTATVNDPCHAFGYSIHQAAFFDDVAHLRITDSTGRVVYDNVLDFDSQTTAVPVIRVTAADGTVLFDQQLPQMDTDRGFSPGREDDAALASLSFHKAAGSNEVATYGAAWKVVDGHLKLAVNAPNADPVEVADGSSVVLDGYRIEYRGAASIPAIRVADMPGAITDDRAAAVQMPVDRDGNPYLFVSGVDDDNLVLQPGRPVTGAERYTYTFGGRLEASGVSVKRDPGGLFIWVAVGMAMVGLAITFYVPRRRLWAKVTGTRTSLAGVAERTTRFSRELRLLGAELGAEDALQPGDLFEP